MLRARLRLKATLLHEHRVEGDSCLLERVPVRGLPQASRLEIGSPGDETDAPMAEPDEVLDGGDGAEEVLRVNGRQRGRTDVVVDSDHRRAGGSIDAAGRDEDDTVRERAADPREVAALPAGLVGLLPQPEKTTSSNPVPWMPSATPLRSSALNGSMSRTSTPITFVRLLRRL